jgi:hypothetical protein
VNDEEARARLRYLELKAKAAAAAPAPVAPPAQEPPGLIRRVADAAVTGVSDAMSTMTGDTYGRNGNPTQRDNLDPRGRLVKAAGGDLIPAVGTMVGDTAMAAGKAVLPEAAENAIASGVRALGSTAPVQAAGRRLAQWRAKSPESYAAAGEAANIAMALLPTKKLPTPNLGPQAASKLAKTMAERRAKETLNMLTPDHPYDQGNLVIDDTAMERKLFVPNKRYQGVIDEVNSVPGVNPRKSYTANKNALEKHVNELDADLSEKLKNAEGIPAPVIDHALKQSVARAHDNLTLVADAGKFADNIYAKFNELVQADMVNGEIAPQSLLGVRRNLDRWLDNSPTDVFGPGGTAAKVATREIRQSINNLVDGAAPQAGVKTTLGRMNKALEARDLMRPRAEGEGTNRLSRYMETLERTTGLKHPVNPQSAYITATNKVVGIGTGAAALGLGLKRGLGESLMKYNVRLSNMLDKAPSQEAKALIIDAMNREKEKRNAP